MLHGRRRRRATLLKRCRQPRFGVLVARLPATVLCIAVELEFSGVRVI
jgi:hypothetical protein